MVSELEWKLKRVDEYWLDAELKDESLYRWLQKKTLGSKMISRAHRFTRRNFIFLRPKMKSFRSGDFLFFYHPLRHGNKLAAVISKKVDKKAVLRNRWRRQVYDVIGQELIQNHNFLALVCLYKGPSIPENTQDLQCAWQDFKAYALKKKLLKFN